MPAKDWIVVADASSARVFEREGRSRHIDLLFSLRHDESRLTTHELVTDRPGRKGRMTPGGSSAYTSVPQETDPHDVEHERFAREIAERLGQSAERHEFDRIHLVMPPRFLGRVRPLLNHAAKERVGVEEALELENLAEAAVIDRIRDIGLNPRGAP